MIYATTNHIGHISNAQKQRATKKTAIQTDREFSQWMQKPKDAGEIKKDKRKAVPIDMLPMVF